MVNISIILDNFSTLNDKYKVSLLLCEIENFDELLTLEKENIMFSLDLLYRYFDDLCLSFGAQKIEVFYYILLYYLTEFNRYVVKPI